MENEGTMVEEGLVSPERTSENDNRPRHFPPNKYPQRDPNRAQIDPKFTHHRPQNDSNKKSTSKKGI